MAATIAPSALSADEIEQLSFDDLSPTDDSSTAPDGIERAEGFFTSYDQTKIFWQAWSASGDGPRRGRIALMHGYAEHSSRYTHVAAALVRAGYDVMAMDARGHGRSEGRDGHVSLFDEYVLDFERMCDVLQERWGDERGPLFVLGHSNGGLIALRYALHRPEAVAGFICTSPFCSIKVDVPLWKAKAGQFMSKVWPTFSMPTGLPPEAVSHDEEVVRQYREDPLVKTSTTARWFTEANGAQQDLQERAQTIDHPVLMLIAGSDEIVDPQASEAVYHKLGSKDRELEVYPDLFHEILNEPEWPQITRRIIGWLERHRADRQEALAAEEE